MAKERKPIHFKEKLFRSFIIVGIIPLLFMAIISYYNISVFTEDKINKSITENLNIISRLADSTLSTFINMTNYISEQEEIQAILSKTSYDNYEDRFKDTQRIYKIANSVLATQTLDVPIHIIDKNRKTRFSTTDYLVPIYEDSRGNFFDIIDGSEGKQLSFIHRRVDGKYSKDIVMAVGRQIRSRNEGGSLGYVISDVYDDYFNDILKNTRTYEKNNVYILDKNGTIITDKLHKNRTGFKFDEGYLDQIIKNEKGVFECTLDNIHYRAYYTTSDHMALKVVELVPISVIYKERAIIIAIFIILMIVFSIMAVIASLTLSRNISKPINELSNIMKKVEEGERDINFPIIGNDEIAQLGKSFNDMIKEINRLIEEVYIKQFLLQQAEFTALKAQVNPHFLYNTLQSINWMAKLSDFEGVSTMVTALGKFLRYSISSREDLVTIGQEIEQIQNYLIIQKTRYGDKFEVSIDVEENIRDHKVLKLMLQPIVENSIIHGIEQKIGKGEIRINVYVRHRELYFDILDNGIGFGNSTAKGEGIGINNVDRRVKIQYGDAFGVSVEKKEEFTCVSIKIPYNDNLHYEKKGDIND